MYKPRENMKAMLTHIPIPHRLKYIRYTVIKGQQIKDENKYFFIFSEKGNTKN